MLLTLPNSQPETQSSSEDENSLSCLDDFCHTARPSIQRRRHTLATPLLSSLLPPGRDVYRSPVRECTRPLHACLASTLCDWRARWIPGSRDTALALRASGNTGKCTASESSAEVSEPQLPTRLIQIRRAASEL